MAESAKDQTIGQVISEAKPVLAEAPEKLAQYQKALDQFLSRVELTGGPGTQAYIQAHALKSAIDGGIVHGDEAIDGIEKLLRQFAFPLTLVGGVKVQGSGEVVAATTGAFKGLQSAMTDAQKYVTIAISIAQCVIIVAGVILAFFPQLGAYSILGGLTISKLIGLAGTYLNVKNSKYPDAPKAELVTVPVKP